MDEGELGDASGGVGLKSGRELPGFSCQGPGAFRHPGLHGRAALTAGKGLFWGSSGDAQPLMS